MRSSSARSKRTPSEELDIRWARQERTEYHGRSWEEVRDLRSKAAKSAAICGECFRPLAEEDSVTMEVRQVGGSRRKGTDRWVRVPVCLFCTLDAMQRPFYFGSHWYRTRCDNCFRPLRLHRPLNHRHWFNSFGTWPDWTPSRNAETCCADCQRLAKNSRNNWRRHVKHEPMTCIECGCSFTPERADAKTCSNRCRQAQHRRRQSGEANTARARSRLRP